MLERAAPSSAGLAALAGYTPGHPWYYVRGGPALPFSVIVADVKARGYRGYRSEIDDVAARPEPQRSTGLRRIRAEVLDELARDVRRYREVVRAYRAWQRGTGPEQIGPFDSVHVAMSLKYNHLANDFAHLLRLDALLARQEQLALF
jgi:hypothetical protein